MKILLMNMRCQYLEILHLTPEEEAFMTDYDDDTTDVEKVEHILESRNIEFDDFNPWWMIVDGDNNVPVFDEVNNSEPLYVIR